jgi:hypothetical protein
MSLITELKQRVKDILSPAYYLAALLNFKRPIDDPTITEEMEEEAMNLLRKIVEKETQDVKENVIIEMTLYRKREGKYTTSCCGKLTALGYWKLLFWRNPLVKIARGIFFHPSICSRSGEILLMCRTSCVKTGVTCNTRE